MKRFLFPLLAALALPNAVNAEVINLECTAKYTEWEKREDFKIEDQYDIYIDIDTEKQISTIDDGEGFIKKFNTFVTRDVYLLTFLNVEDKKNESYEINRVNGSYVFTEKILKVDKKSAYFEQDFYDVVMEDKERFGSILLPFKEGGTCKKAKKTKTMF